MGPPARRNAARRTFSFFHSANKRPCKEASWAYKKTAVPRRRWGKTELSIPVIPFGTQGFGGHFGSG